MKSGNAMAIATRSSDGGGGTNVGGGFRRGMASSQGRRTRNSKLKAAITASNAQRQPMLKAGDLCE